MKPITISIATIPSRAAWLERVIAALRPQCDRLLVACNHFAEGPIPEYPGTEARRGAGPASEKFAPIRALLDRPRGERGYLLTCDDDIYYPRDYVRRMTGTLDAWGGRAVATAHGACLLGNARELQDFVWEASFPEASRADWINVPGTGVMGIDLDALPDGVLMALLDDDGPRNLDDLAVGVWAQRHGVPIRMVARGREWLREIDPGHDGLGRTCQSRAAPVIAGWTDRSGGWILNALPQRMRVRPEPLATDARPIEVPATTIARVLSEQRGRSLANAAERNAVADAMIAALRL